MELLIAGLVNATADVLWLVAFATGFTFTGRTTTVAATPWGRLPAEIDLVEVQAGRMTPAEFHARMSARV